MTSQAVAKIEQRMESIIATIPEEVLQLRQAWVESKEAELSHAQEAYRELKLLKATPARLLRCKRTVGLLRKVVKALKAGYIPVPRFQAQTLRFDLEELPLKVITAVHTAKTRRLFDEFRIIQGQEMQNYSGRGHAIRRDPLIVGITRMPDIIFKTQEGWISQRIPFEEHFLIAWWRPEDVQPWDRF